MKSFIGFLDKWHLVIALGVCACFALAATGYKLASQNNPSPTVQELKPSTSGKLTVAKPTAQTLSNSTLTADSPPSSASSSLQSQTSNPGEASSSPIQSNANINDPSISNNPLVQSLTLPGSQ